MPHWSRFSFATSMHERETNMKLLAAITLAISLSSATYAATLPVSVCETTPTNDAHVQQLLDSACTNDWFAGAMVTVDIMGKIYTVDRRAEPRRPSGQSPESVSQSLGDIVSGMQSKSSGEITGEFKWSQYPDGTLREGYIKITAKGSSQIGKEPNAPKPIEKEETGQ